MTTEGTETVVLMAAVFGYKQRAAAGTPLLESALKVALDRGRLRQSGSGLLTAD